MKNKSTLYHVIRSILLTGGATGMLALAPTTWAANDLDTPMVMKRLNPDGSDSLNMELVGWNDAHGRVIYQTSIHNQNGRVIAYAGHFNGKATNLLTGQIETNGTSIIDVTDPAHTVYLKHLAANNGGARMNRLCDGNDLPKGAKGRTYLLRENGATSHEVYDVTDPSNPTLVSTPVTGVSVTHKNYWDCSTGLAYIVVGTTTTSAKPDGWFSSGSNQHVRIFDMADPANPKYIMDFGLPGQNPGSAVKPPPSGVHGPIVVSTLNGKTYNRLYMPYGVGNDGVIQIVDLVKLLPAPYGSGKYVDPSKPTDAELVQAEIGRITMPGAEGGHTSWPMYGMQLQNIQNFTDNTTRDILAVTSEETDNRCTGSPHYMYLLDITAKIAKGGASSAEQHPWPISTVTVDDRSGRPNYCSRGTRFGVHSTHEAFDNDLYGKLVTSAWFDAGIRVTDVRDPYHPKEVAYYVYPINISTQPSSSTINGVIYNQLDVSCDNTEVDSDNLIYCGDRVGGGLYITRLTGPAAQIIGGGDKKARARLQR
jgi:hypothetical protein